MSTRRLPMAFLLALALLPARSAAAQSGADGSDGAADSGETNIARVQRDQSRIGLRVTSLRDKMERLAQRYDDEGRTRNATLLREALKQYDDQKLADLSRDVERSLEQGNLSTVEQQDALAKSLEDIYAVLRDRRDADELRRQSDLARQGVSELSFLAQNERSLLSATHAATDNPGSLVEQALSLLAQLDQALKSSAGATQTAQSAEAAIGDAALADELARGQRALAAEPAPTAQTESLLQAALALLRERLQHPAQPKDGAALGDELLAAAQTARDEAAAAAARADEAMTAAHAALQRAESSGAAPHSTNPAGQQPPTGERAAGDESANREAAGGDKAAAGDKAAGDKAAGDKAAGDKAAGDKAAADKAAADKAAADKAADANTAGDKATGDNSAGDKAGDANAAGDKAASDNAAGDKAAGDKAAGEKAAGDKAAGKTPGSKPPGAPSSDSLTDARQAMDKAASELESARDALEKSERSLTAAKNRAEALAKATTQDAAKSASGMEDLAQRLESVQPEEGPELLDRTRQLIEDLSRLAQAVDDGDAAGAQESGASAQTSLDELIKQLQARAARTPDTAPKAADPQQLGALAQQQEELAARARELMKRLSELPDQKFSQPGDAAVQSMGGAEKALRSGDSSEAAVREEEAAEKLEQAAKQLAGEQDKYEQLRQEEVLFRIGEDLKALVEKQDAVSAETKEIDDGRGDEDRLGRSQARAVGRLASQERDLAAQAERIRSALSDDGSVSFTFAMERTRDDFNNAADLLGREQTGYLVQAVQSDARQRLADLLDVLNQELERRRNAKVEDAPPGDNQPPQKESLVPAVAELLLVQRMEQAALARLESFEKLNPALAEEAELDPASRALIERWAQEHVKVTEMFKSMVPEQPGAPGAGGEGEEPGARPAPGGQQDKEHP